MKTKIGPLLPKSALLVLGFVAIIGVLVFIPRNKEEMNVSKKN